MLVLYHRLSLVMDVKHGNDTQLISTQPSNRMKQEGSERHNELHVEFEAQARQSLFEKRKKKSDIRNVQLWGDEASL